MPDSTILEQISNQFKPVTSEEWKNKIIKDLKGDDFDKLVSHTEDGIEILPFYTAETTKDFRLHIPKKQTDNWLITEAVKVDDVLKANKESLHALENGANALVFDLQQRSLSAEDILQLTTGILLDIAPVFFYNYDAENKQDLESVVPNSCISVIVIEQQKSTVNELADALQKGAEQTSDVIFFHFQTGQNYFLEIAKLRAFRWLWQQVCTTQNISTSMFVIAQTGNSKRDETAHANEIYNNILRNTTEAMSAIIGGCDYLIVNSHDVATIDSDFGKRIARNMQHILQQESYFNNSSDLAKASYYIEYLTYQLAEKAWNQLTSV
jgi:methylmalonyl-CoA mutase